MSWRGARSRHRSAFPPRRTRGRRDPGGLCSCCGSPGLLPRAPSTRATSAAMSSLSMSRWMRAGVPAPTRWDSTATPPPEPRARYIASPVGSTPCTPAQKASPAAQSASGWSMRIRPMRERCIGLDANQPDGVHRTRPTARTAGVPTAPLLAAPPTPALWVSAVDARLRPGVGRGFPRIRLDGLTCDPMPERCEQFTEAIRRVVRRRASVCRCGSSLSRSHGAAPHDHSARPEGGCELLRAGGRSKATQT